MNLMRLPRILFLLSVIVALSGCEFWEIDRCLDKGGYWNYELGQCEFEPKTKPGRVGT